MGTGESRGVGFRECWGRGDMCVVGGLSKGDFSLRTIFMDFSGDFTLFHCMLVCVQQPHAFFCQVFIINIKQLLLLLLSLSLSLSLLLISPSCFHGVVFLQCPQAVGLQLKDPSCPRRKMS